MTDIDGLIERLRSLSRAEHDDISIGDEAATALADLRAKLDATEGENTRLRAALANSDQPCIYCTLSKEDWAKCEHGFPGCSRADDAMGCPELGASLEAARLKAMLVKAREGLGPFADGWEKFKHCIPEDMSLDDHYPGSWATNGNYRRAAALVREIDEVVK